MATLKEIINLLKPAEIVYQHPISEAEAKTYHELLRSYEACVIGAAVELHMMTSKYFPKPCELIEFIVPIVDMGPYKLTKLDIQERQAIIGRV